MRRSGIFCVEVLHNMYVRTGVMRIHRGRARDHGCRLCTRAWNGYGLSMMKPSPLPPIALGSSPTLALRAVPHSEQTRSSGAIISSQLWHTAVSCRKRVINDNSSSSANNNRSIVATPNLRQPLNHAPTAVPPQSGCVNNI